MDDIDMAAYTETQYNIIGNSTTNFSGIFDGKGHAIRNLTIYRPSGNYIGLIGYADWHSTIQNLRIENILIRGNDVSNHVGGLCGSSYGEIIQCYSTGEISGRIFVGGLCGYMYGTMRNCFSTCTVTGREKVGGLCGMNSKMVQDCYATGAVNGPTEIGGLIGYNMGKVIRCYSTGSVPEFLLPVGSVESPISRIILSMKTPAISGISSHPATEPVSWEPA